MILLHRLGIQVCWKCLSVLIATQLMSKNTGISTCYHFPLGFSCKIYDVYFLLGLAAKSGKVFVYGRPGVELQYELQEESVITKLVFIPGILIIHFTLFCYDFDIFHRRKPDRFWVVFV